MDSNGRPGLDHQPLLEAVLHEQSVRWGQGERPGAEEFFERFPAMRDHPEAALDVIYQEFLLRRELGEQPRPEEFIERFPFVSEPLIAQLATDKAMRLAEATTEVTAGTDPALHCDGAKAAADAGLDDKHLFPSFPGYELIGMIGQGGMGVVYKARNTMLGRVVALKTITGLEPAKPGQSGRFLDEARVAARLQHPNIITVHEIGEFQGRPYFVQEFVAGGDLKKRLADKPMAVGQAAEMLEILARAVHAAHQAPETLEVVNDLACVNNEQGNEARGAGRHSEAQAKYVKAEQLLKVIVSELEQRRGRDHPATLVAKSNLADSYRWRGRLAEAIELRNEVLAARRRVLGNQHPGTLYMMVSLAEADRELPNLKEAQSLLEEAIKGCRSALDRNHETAVAALAILADVYQRQGEIEKMGPVLIKAREITLFRWGPDHGLTYGANQAVAAYWQFKRNDHAKAESYLRDSLGYLVNHPEMADRFKTESRLGLSLLVQKKYVDAKQRLLSAYSSMRTREQTIPPEQNADLPNIVQWTARLYHESAASPADKDYDLIRADPGFQAAVLDLGFPADPFAPR